MSKKIKINTISQKKSVDYFLPLLLFATFIIFIKGMSSELLNFDDNEYFLNYPEVLNLSFDSIKKFFTSYYVLMYQPLPILSFALTYSFFKLDPTAHHLINLGFHLFNIYLVYQLVGKFTDKVFVKKSVAFLFALHPLAVEAVVWFSCRSSGMYACFYLLGLLSYIQFRQTEQIKTILLCGVWFILSLMSKAHAVTFPLTLIVLDIFLFKIPFGKKLMLNKIPFFGLSLLFGVITLLNKDTANNISFGSANYTVFDHFFLLNYEIVWYYLKILIPFNLSPIVVYPIKSDGFLPVVYYIAPLLILALFYWVYSCYKKHPYVIFGMLFFLTALSVSLQILPSRQIIVADRYGYLANVGLFFILAHGLSDWKDGKIKWLNSFKFNTVLVSSITILFLFLTWRQIDIWKNNATLATRIIDANPETDYIGRAYGIRANFKKEQTNDVLGALSDYKKAIELDSNDWIAYYQSGVIHKSLNEENQAIQCYEKAYQKNHRSPFPLTDLGVLYFEKKDNAKALLYADSALKTDQKFHKALNLKAVALLNLGNALEAETYFTKAIASKPDYAEAIKNRGIVRLNNLNNKSGACLDFRKAAELGEPGMEQIVNDYCK